jgi:hypothetical protein
MAEEEIVRVSYISANSIIISEIIKVNVMKCANVKYCLFGKGVRWEMVTRFCFWSVFSYFVEEFYKSEMSRR